MNTFNIISHIVVAAVFFLFNFVLAENQNSRFGVEDENALFIIEPEGKYTWKQASYECKKEHFNLIEPKSDYDFAKITDAIKHNLTSYSSFWTNSQVKWTTVFHQIGLAKERYNRIQCNKFDNSSFKFIPDNCDNRYGFICEKSLLRGYSVFNTQDMVYFVQPEQEFTCEKAYDQCEQRHMSLVVLKDHASNQLLKNYLFTNYGSGVNYWYSYNNETHYNCATYPNGQPLEYNSKLGFVCQRPQSHSSSALAARHMIFLILLTITGFLGTIMFVIIKCIRYKAQDSFDLPEAYFTSEIKTIEIN